MTRIIHNPKKAILQTMIVLIQKQLSLYLNYIQKHIVKRIFTRDGSMCIFFSLFNRSLQLKLFHRIYMIRSVF